MNNKKCGKCGVMFQYDPWVDDRDLCPTCVSGSSPEKPSDAEAEIVAEETRRPRSQQISETQSNASVRPNATESGMSDQAEDDLANLTARVGKKLVDKGVKTLGNTFKYLDKSRVVDEFRSTDFQREIISHDADSVRNMLHNTTFWIAMFMGILPLLIQSFTNDLSKTLYGLIFFFAVMWAGIFKGFILDSSASLKLPTMAFFFTGAIGIKALFFYYEFLPASYLHMSENANYFVRLLGSVIETGVNEEICKFVPVAIYIVWKRKTWSVGDALLIGVFSGLGFAAYENIMYVYGRLVYNSNISSMVWMIIRSLSCLFGHAVYTGIATSFVISGLLIPKRRIVRFFLALALPAIIHGSYNWFQGYLFLGSALVNAVAFALFFGYLRRIKNMLADA